MGRIDIDRPVDIGFDVPLAALGLFVELLQRRTRALLVVPRENGLGVVGHRVFDGVDIGVDHSDNGFDIIHIAIGELFGHLTTPFVSIGRTPRRPAGL